MKNYSAFPERGKGYRYTKEERQKTRSAILYGCQTRGGGKVSKNSQNLICGRGILES